MKQKVHISSNHLPLTIIFINNSLIDLQDLSHTYPYNMRQIFRLFYQNDLTLFSIICALRNAYYCCFSYLQRHMEFSFSRFQIWGKDHKCNRIEFINTYDRDLVEDWIIIRLLYTPSLQSGAYKEFCHGGGGILETISVIHEEKLPPQLEG